MNLSATANTANGFAIGVARNTRSGAFEVIRMNRQSRAVSISRHETEQAARDAANREWMLDKVAA
jgi:hypothetical protein